MAYLHCHNCDFSQDDYWYESYNPIRWLLNWEEDLLTKNLDELVEWGEDEEGFEKITWREVFARELERKAKTIRTMKYRTHEDFKKANPQWICPKCGQKELDVD